MPEVISCPQCSRQLRVPEDLLGKRVKCPTCSAVFTAEASAAPPPPAPTRERTDPQEDELPRRAAARDLDLDADEDQGDYPDRPRRRRPRGDYEPHRGTTILVLGILGLVLNFFLLCGLVLGPIAWVMGNSDLREMRAGRMDPEGEGTTNAGRICGIIATILGILGLICSVIYFMFLAAMIKAGALH